NGLLELSRIGRSLNPPTDVSMSKLAEEVLALLAGPIQLRQAKVTVQPGFPDAHGDAQRLQEVVQNLVENALKFSAAGRAPEIEIGFQTGLGLALVRRIVEFHGGKVWFESAGIGKGSTFYLILLPSKAIYD